jgi:hypothetical protein
VASRSIRAVKAREQQLRLEGMTGGKAGKVAASLVTGIKRKKQKKGKKVVIQGRAFARILQHCCGWLKPVCLGATNRCSWLLLPPHPRRTPSRPPSGSCLTATA